jgi:hypothetical protein
MVDRVPCPPARRGHALEFQTGTSIGFACPRKAGGHGTQRSGWHKRRCRRRSPEYPACGAKRSARTTRPGCFTVRCSTLRPADGRFTSPVSPLPPPLSHCQAHDSGDRRPDVDSPRVESRRRAAEQGSKNVTRDRFDIGRIGKVVHSPRACQEQREQHQLNWCSMDSIAAWHACDVSKMRGTFRRSNNCPQRNSRRDADADLCRRAHAESLASHAVAPTRRRPGNLHAASNDRSRPPRSRASA